MPTLTVMCGISGSGKSTYAKKMYLDDENWLTTEWLSSDKIRAELYGDESIQGNPKRVFRTMNERMAIALKEGYNVIYDATNLCASRRKDLISLARQSAANVKCECVVMATSFFDCIANQEKRRRKVPYDVIARQYYQKEEPTAAEGWDIITLYPAN